MSSLLYADNVSDGTRSNSVNNLYNGMAKLMIQYKTDSAPYLASIEKSIGVSSVTDIQTGIQEFSPSINLGVIINSRPLMCGVSTDVAASSFGYHGALFTTYGRYRFAYYTTGWAAASYISCMGF